MIVTNCKKVRNTKIIFNLFQSSDRYRNTKLFNPKAVGWNSETLFSKQFLNFISQERHIRISGS